MLGVCAGLDVTLHLTRIMGMKITLEKLDLCLKMKRLECLSTLTLTMHFYMSQYKCQSSFISLVRSSN